MKKISLTDVVIYEDSYSFPKTIKSSKKVKRKKLSF